MHHNIYTKKYHSAKQLKDVRKAHEAGRQRNQLTKRSKGWFKRLFKI